jgi:hypothetical protein
MVYREIRSTPDRFNVSDAASLRKCMSRNELQSRGTVLRCLGAIALFGYAVAALSQSPIPTTTTHADSASPPAGDAFSYAGYGDNERGHYKIFFQSLTTPDEYLKHLLIWVRIDWASPQKSGADSYASELMLFHIDCKASIYSISSRLYVGSNGHIVKRTDVKPQDYKHETMPTPTNRVFVKGKSPAELGAAAQLMDGC